MKIKLDENITVEVIPALSAVGHDVDTVAMEDMTGQPDSFLIRPESQRTPANIVMPAKAGIQSGEHRTPQPWIPAFAGMTVPLGPLLLRLWQSGRLAQIDYIEGLVRQYDLNDWAGCHVVATEHKVRVRRAARSG